MIPVEGEIVEMDPPKTLSALRSLLNNLGSGSGSHWRSTKIRDGSTWIANSFAKRENRRVMDWMDVEDLSMCGHVLYLSRTECEEMQDDGFKKARSMDGVPMLPIFGRGKSLSDNTRWKIKRAGCIYHKSTSLWWASPDVFEEMRKIIEDETV